MEKVFPMKKPSKSVKMEKEQKNATRKEKRRHARINTSNTVEYILFDEYQKKIGFGKGRTLNLSQSGTLLETRNLLEGSFIVLMTFDLAGKQVQVKGSIAHTSISDKPGYYFTGIQFAGSTEESTKAIVTFVQVYYRSKHAIKVYVQPDETATIYCPYCNKTKDQDVSRFKGKMYAKLKCACGKVSTFQLEFRRYFRKQTQLQGFYRLIDSGSKPVDAGNMTVVELSRNGVRMEIRNFPRHLADEDIVNIQFNLDDGNRSFINRDVVVQNIQPPYVGASFHRAFETDNVIGFYLFK